MRWLPAGLALLGVAACAPASSIQVSPGSAQRVTPSEANGSGRDTTTYRLLVAAESDDEVALIEFRRCPTEAPSKPITCGPRVVREYIVGLTPSDIEGPHGVVASPSGKVMYVTLAHGRPNGLLQKYSLESGDLIGQVELGMFPATLDISSDGRTVWVVNFNFHDPSMGVSSVSAVDAATMLELARIETCRMPHGSRLSADGTRHYSACMMDDLLVEIDTKTMQVSRRLSLRGGNAPEATGSHAAHADPVCSPTWAEPSPDGTTVYVACNKSNEVAEVSVAEWRITRRWATPKAPYNFAVTPDGALLVSTQKGPATTTVWRLDDAKLLGEIPGTRPVASGVAVSDDGRYAFVTLEGKGGDPGTVDLIDLETLQKAASVETGKQAGGVAVVP
jgi:DNA-binding beta-propeller fold protein YncE